MDFGKAFTFFFDDEDWFDKLIIPLLVSLIPIVGGFALTGYVLRTIANVAKGLANPLPRFDFGEDLGRGFRFFLVELVWSIPAFILAGLIFIPTRMLERADGNPIAWILLVLFIGFILLYALLMFLVQPIMTANFAVKDTFASGFEVGEFFRRLRNNFGAWLLVFGGMLLAGLIAPMGSIVFIIGAFVTAAYAQFMVAHLTGQAYAVSNVKQ